MILKLIYLIVGIVVAAAIPLLILAAAIWWADKTEEK